MRIKKSDIEEAKPVAKKEVVEPVVDGKNEILAAIKKIKVKAVNPVVVDTKIPAEILKQQKAMMKKLSEVPTPPNYPTYHFEINRSSDGYIKSVDATPTNIDNETTSKSWLKKAQDWYSK